MNGQSEIRSEIPAKAKAAAMDGVLLRLQEFLRYQLKVVAALVSEARQQITDRSAQLVAEAIAQDGVKANARQM